MEARGGAPAPFLGSFASSLMLGFHDFKNSNLNSIDAKQLEREEHESVAGKEECGAAHKAKVLAAKVNKRNK